MHSTLAVGLTKEYTMSDARVRGPSMAAAMGETPEYFHSNFIDANGGFSRGQYINI